MTLLLTCRQFLDELNAFLDDSTDPEFRAQLTRHVSECPNCWVVVDTTRKTIDVYKGMDPTPIPEPMRAKLLAAIARKTAAHS